MKGKIKRKNSQAVKVASVYFCWDEWEVFSHRLVCCCLFTTTSQNPHILWFFLHPCPFHLFADWFCLLCCDSILLAQFGNHLIGLTFSICNLVFGVVYVGQILIKMGLADLAIIRVGLCKGERLGKKKCYVWEVLLKGVADSLFEL